MKLIELLDNLKDNKKIDETTYRIDVRGIRNSISYATGIQSKVRKRISDNVLNMTVIGAISKEDGCSIVVDDSK